MGITTRHSGKWTLEDRFASPWHYLPVEVTPGTCALRAELAYDPSSAVLVRGWSCGARQAFVITAEDATPGYRPVDLEPGPWEVVIGIYRLPLDGIEFSLTAEVASGRGQLMPERRPEPPPPLSDRPARRELPARPGHRWLAGDLHTHTVHSDGAQTVPELARFAALQGLDFLAITDHNTVSHHAELPAAAARYGITLVPGQEITRPEER